MSGDLKQVQQLNDNGATHFMLTSI